jgi:hypothetical protein
MVGMTVFVAFLMMIMIWLAVAIGREKDHYRRPRPR